MAKILIKNGKIWDGEKFFFGDVLTNDNFVEKMDASINDQAEYVYEAEGRIVSAGLVDIHVHLKGISLEQFGIQAEMSSFPFGVTAVNDAGSVHGDKTLLDYLAVKSTVFVAAEIKNNHARLENTQKCLKKYGDKAVGIKIYFDKTVSEVSDITALKEVCAYANDRKLKVMVHCSNSPVSMKEIVKTLSSGDILTHAFHGGESMCTEDDFEALRLAKQKGVVIDAGFAGHVHTDFSVLSKAVRSGLLPDTISTDITRLSAYKRGGRYGMTMCMSLARLAGMSEEDIFKAITSTPAKALGKKNEWGCLKEGRVADLAVFDYSDEGFELTDNAGNRVASDKGYRCVLTIADGDIVYRR